jgi:two-component system invasion response regulator UvrY
MAKIVLIDDHILMRNGLAGHLQKMGHNVLFQADNGQQFINELPRHPLPEIVILDINMPVMDGYETAGWLRTQHPTIKMLALSMYDDEHSILRMIKLGAKGYIPKDCHPVELQNAIESLLLKGYYHTEHVSTALMDSVAKPEQYMDVIQNWGLTDKEVEFLKLICSEMTYKEIADHMHVSPRTVDGYRDGLFEKLTIRSRVGLVLFAIKHGIVKV